ncbi:hypothetical protein Tco_0997815 [Tanacetum coccineum]
MSDRKESLEFFFHGAEGGGAVGSLEALKPSTHPVIAILLYTLGAKVEAACALKVEATRALDLVDSLKVEVKPMGAMDVVISH